MAKDYVISVMSRDRVGIVASVTKAIHSLSGNVDALSQTVLRGYFTIILTASLPDDVSEAELRARVAKSGAPGELEVSVKARLPVASIHAESADKFVLTIQGQDRPGVISRISAYLSSRSINIVDLYAFVDKGEFILVSQLEVPSRLDLGQIQIDLEGLSVGSDLFIRLQHENIFSATNEIEFHHTGLRPR